MVGWFCVYSEAIIRASVSPRAAVTDRTAGDSFSPPKKLELWNHFNQMFTQLLVCIWPLLLGQQKTSFLLTVTFPGATSIWIFWGNMAASTIEILPTNRFEKKWKKNYCKAVNRLKGILSDSVWERSLAKRARNLEKWQPWLFVQTLDVTHIWKSNLLQSANDYCRLSAEKAEVACDFLNLPTTFCCLNLSKWRGDKTTLIWVDFGAFMWVKHPIWLFRQKGLSHKGPMKGMIEIKHMKRQRRSIKKAEDLHRIGSNQPY